MSKDRKEKANKKRASRAERYRTSLEQARETLKRTGETLERSKKLNEQIMNGTYPAEQGKTTEVIVPPQGGPRISQSMADKVNESIRNGRAAFEDNALDKPAHISAFNPRITDSLDVSGKAAGAVAGKARVANPSDITDEKPMTISDYLAEQREKLVKDKTDAVKMQKYYALTDALQALGKMGGTAIGGAIGGNMLDGASVVDDYEPSRGYLDAFEQARKANDRIRELDDKEFQLAYSKEQRDEERAYKAQLDALDKKWQKDMIDYKAKIEQAATEGNLKLKAQYEAEAAAREQKYLLERLAVTHANDKEIKEISERIVKMQTSAGKDLQPFTFEDGSVINVPKDLFKEMGAFYASKGQIGGEYVDEDNVLDVLRKHPKLVNDFLATHKYVADYQVKGGSSASQGQDIVRTPINMGDSRYPYYQYVDDKNPVNYPGNYVELNPENRGFEISGYKRK